MDVLFDDFDGLSALEELIWMAEKCAAEAEAETADQLIEAEIASTLEELVTRVCLLEKYERTSNGETTPCSSEAGKGIAHATVKREMTTNAAAQVAPGQADNLLEDSLSSGISSRASELSSDDSSDNEDRSYSPEREWRRYARTHRSRSSGLSTASPASDKCQASDVSSVSKRKAEESRESSPRVKRSRRSRSSSRNSRRSSRRSRRSSRSSRSLSRSSASSDSSTDTFASFDRRCRERSFSPRRPSSYRPAPNPNHARTDVGCHDCRKRYPCIQELVKHEMHSHGKGKVKCPFCKKRKDCADDLIDHLKAKHASRTLRCPQCKSNHYSEQIEEVRDKAWTEFRDHVYYEILKVRTYTHSLLNRKGPHFRRGLGSCPHGPPTKCKNFPKCPGQKCYFSHGPCRYNFRCRNSECPYDHTERPRICRSCWNEFEKYTGMKVHH